MTPLPQLHAFAEAEYQRQRAAWGWQGQRPAPRNIPADRMEDIVVWSHIRCMIGRDAGAPEWQKRGPSYWTACEREDMARRTLTALKASKEETAEQRERALMLWRLTQYLRWPANYRRDLAGSAPACAA